MSKNRTGRINEEVTKVIAETLQEVKDPRLQSSLISVVRCEVTRDLSYATVYISTFGEQGKEKEILEGLKSAKGFLRRAVARRVQLRITPDLIFRMDESISHGAHINELLYETRKKDDAKK